MLRLMLLLELSEELALLIVEDLIFLEFSGADLIFQG
jgi:hypothetical protein